MIQIDLRVSLRFPTEGGRGWNPGHKSWCPWELGSYIGFVRHTILNQNYAIVILTIYLSVIPSPPGAPLVGLRPESLEPAEVEMTLSIRWMRSCLDKTVKEECEKSSYNGRDNELKQVLKNCVFNISVGHVEIFSHANAVDHPRATGTSSTAWGMMTRGGVIYILP